MSHNFAALIDRKCLRFTACNGVKTMVGGPRTSVTA